MSMTKDLHNTVEYAPSLAPDLHDGGAVDGAEVDLQGFESCECVVQIGTVIGTATMDIEHAPDDGTGSSGTFVAVPVADLDLTGVPAANQQAAAGGLADVTTSNDAVTFQVGYRGTNRFVRFGLTDDGTSIEMMAGFLRGHQRHI